MSSSAGKLQPTRASLPITFLLLAAGLRSVQAAPDQCVVSILNRVSEVKPDGTWKVDNLPANLGLVRARFSCVENGVTRTGQSKFFQIPADQFTGFESTFSLDDPASVPSSISIAAAPTLLRAEGATSRLAVTARFVDGTTGDVTPVSKGTSYVTSNPGIATVSADGTVTAVKSGTAVISAMNENILASVDITVSFAGDSDGDGIPDDVEIALGLDPNNAADAKEDVDEDGLTAIEESRAGTNLFVPDTDGDFVNDGEEVAAGTNPLDAKSTSYAGRLASISISPRVVTLKTNEILPAEVTRQLMVSGVLKTGQVVDLTGRGKGTTYTSSDLTVVNFGDADGLLFAGEPGSALVTAMNSGSSASVPVLVTLFTPVALGFVSIPGQANNVDTVESIAYVAAGGAGLQVVDVANPRSPQIIGVLDTAGNANDVVVSGGFAYVVDGTSGLVVIDVSDPTNPVRKGMLGTPGVANDVVVRGSVAYVASGPSGLQLIDVSNPAVPKILGSVDTPGTVYGVDVDEERKIAAVADGPAGLQVIDVSDPGTPARLGGVDTQVGDDGGLDVVIAGNYAYVANGSPSGFNGGLVAVDISDATRPVIAGTTPENLSNLWDIVVVGDLALAADTYAAQFQLSSVQTFNLTEPSTPVAALPIDFSGDANFRNDYGTGIDAERGFVYLTGARCLGFTHHGASCSGGLHIGQFLDTADDVVDDLGIPPTVSIDSPANGAEVVEGTTITVVASASDDVEVALVQFFAGVQLVSTDTSRPFTATLNVPLGMGSFDVGARALDVGNNLSSKATVTLVVRPDLTPPTVRITSPADGSTVLEGQSISIAADATDDVAVDRVELSTSTGFFESDSLLPYEATFSVPASQGVTEVIIRATAFDKHGNSTAAPPVRVNVRKAGLVTLQISGIVRLPDGTAAAGASVRTSVGAQTTAGPDGSFSLDVEALQGTTFSAVLTFELGGRRFSKAVKLEASAGTETVDLGAVVLVEIPRDLFPNRVIETGAGPGSIAAHDLDGDGDADLAVANADSNTVSVLLNQGGGTFTAHVEYVVGSTPYSVALGDLDGDGDADLAAANNSASGTVSILRNQGDGTFATQVQYGAGSAPIAIALGDLDRDGDMDLSVANQGSGTVSVLRNQGNGTFATHVQYSVGSGPFSVALGDLDQDADADVAVTNRSSNTVSVLRNQGDGTFAAQVQYGVGSLPGSVALGDLDGDGFKDLAVANSSSSTVSVLRNAGDGTFAAHAQYSVGGAGSAPIFGALGDLDGDGDSDIAVANASSNTVSILSNEGDGTFTAAVQYGVGTNPFSVALEDLDGDGVADLAVANRGSNTVSVILNRGSGVLVAQLQYVVGSTPTSVAQGDVNGDGGADLAVANASSNTVSILSNEGEGTFAAHVQYGVGFSPSSVAIEDLDGDVVADLAVANRGSNTVSVLQNLGDGTFAAHVQYGAGGGGSVPSSVALGDVDKDGDADLAVANSHIVFGTVSVLQNQADGTFAAQVQYGAGAEPSSVAQGDIDGDGDADLAVANAGFNTNTVSVLLSQGDGTFANQVQYGVGARPISVAQGDIDGDGDADILVANQGSNSASVLRNQGDGSFEGQVQYDAGNSPSSIALRDLDGDGRADLVVANGSSNTVSVLLNPGDGTFAAQVQYGVGVSPSSVTLSDLDRDGDMDIVVANSSGGTVSILLNQSVR